MTLPLGVLKKSPKLFTPALPKEKQEAIKNLGFGSLQKIFLEYSTAWWSGNASTLVTPYSSQNNILGSQIKMFEVFDYRNNASLVIFQYRVPGSDLGPVSVRIRTPRDSRKEFQGDWGSHHKSFEDSLLGQQYPRTKNCLHVSLFPSENTTSSDSIGMPTLCGTEPILLSVPTGTRNRSILLTF